MKSKEKFAVLLNRLLRRLSTVNRDEKICCGLTMPQCITIEIAAEYQPIGMTRLSQLAGADESTMTRVVDLLVRDKLMQRERDIDDRRRVLISLTAAGSQIAEKLHDCSAGYARCVSEAIPAGKRKQVDECLELILNALDSISQSCCSTKET